MAAVTVYTTDHCPYCTQAKELLKRKGIAFAEIKVDRGDDKTRQELLGRSGMRTFPQIFNGDALIGGYTELAELDQKDGLASIKIQ